jgi:hypothetical protein
VSEQRLQFFRNVNRPIFSIAGEMGRGVCFKGPGEERDSFIRLNGVDFLAWYFHHHLNFVGFGNFEISVPTLLVT